MNNEFRSAPWADVLYAPDARWWRVYGGEAEQRFEGEFWSCATEAPDVNWIEAIDDAGLSTNPNRIHAGGNSGYQAIGLAFLWGAARIVLLGYDMKRGAGGRAHHYGNHEGGLPNLGNLMWWGRRFVQLAIDLRKQGVEVINATRDSALTCFERSSLGEALA